jgi:hypothetical protein
LVITGGGEVEGDPILFRLSDVTCNTRTVLIAAFAVGGETL